MGESNTTPGYRLESEDQCKNWILELVATTVKSRDLCDVIIPDDTAATVRHQQSSYRKFMVKHGAAMGALMALHRTEDISDVLHDELRKIVMDTLIPTIVGVPG